MTGLGLGIGLAALGVAIGLGLIGYAALSGMARQPEAIGRLQIAMLIALAFVELVFLLTVFVVPGAVGGAEAAIHGAGGGTAAGAPH
jgi:F-type H+-transporting ATPase subunit c